MGTLRDARRVLSRSGAVLTDARALFFLRSFYFANTILLLPFFFSSSSARRFRSRDFGDDHRTCPCTLVKSSLFIFLFLSDCAEGEERCRFPAFLPVPSSVALLAVPSRVFLRRVMPRRHLSRGMQMSSHAVNYSYCLPGYEFQRRAHLYAIFYTRSIYEMRLSRSPLPPPPPSFFLFFLSLFVLLRASFHASEIEQDDRN